MNATKREESLMSNNFSLFSVYGIEAEYMIVDTSTLKVKAIADLVLKELNNGVICNEVELGRVSWSNELVNHVLEIKCTEPEPILIGLDDLFHRSIKDVQQILTKWNCTLMPTSMNPWFNPEEETVLWPHDQREVYNLYNEIFNCKGHGWSNLQSVHINLPYKDENEFVLLHSAVRVILPLIPYFSASSPFFEGKKQKLADNRLGFYEKNQAKIPSIIGNIIPENIQSTKEYMNILEDVYKDISTFDHAKTLQHPWLNSRAAIPKFDVGAIEIRIMDIQESSYMDYVLVNFFVELIKFVLKADKSSHNTGRFSDQYLRMVYDKSKEFDPKVDLANYFSLFGLKVDDGSFKEFRTKLIDQFTDKLDKKYHEGLKVIRNEGSLANRLVKKELSTGLYTELIDCLTHNTFYTLNK